MVEWRICEGVKRNAKGTLVRKNRQAPNTTDIGEPITIALVVSKDVRMGSAPVCPLPAHTEGQH